MNQPSYQAPVDFKKRGNESPQKVHFSVSFIIRNTRNKRPPIPIPELFDDSDIYVNLLR